MTVSLFAAALLAVGQNVAATDEVVGAPSPVRSAELACSLRTADDRSIEVDVTYNASNHQVRVEIPSLQHSFTRIADFDDRFMMWTEYEQVGSAALWTIVRATLEIRLTRIFGSSPRVNSGRCQVGPRVR